MNDYKGENAADSARGPASRGSRPEGAVPGLRWRGRLWACIAAVVLAGACASDDKVTPPPSDQTPPTVTAVVPTDGSTGIAVDTPVAVTFSEKIDPNSVKTASLTLAGSSGPVPGTAASSGDNMVVFSYQAPLGSNELYTATLTTDVTDMAGNALEQSLQWTFTTATTPVADAGEDQDADMGELVILDGSGSFHPDGKSFDYEWRQVPGQQPTVNLIGPDSAKPRFTTPNEVVTLEFELVVTSGDGSSAPARVQVLVFEDKANAIFVSTTNGNDGNPGTRTNPLKTFAAAISKSLNRGLGGGELSDIYVAEGTYDEHVLAVTQINLYGGFEEGTAPDTTWSRRRPDPSNPSNESVITGGDFTRGPSRMAVETRTQNHITIDGFTIKSRDATNDNGSSFAVSIYNSDAITISRCNIIAGNGARGADGANIGSIGDDGGEGGDGRNGVCNIACPQCVACGGPSGNCNEGGVGGGQQDLAANGDGGGGGVSGTGCGCEGEDGESSNGVSGGDGGTAPSGEGDPGRIGVPGADGNEGGNFGSLATLGYNGASGSTGAPGSRGSGGGGGAGGGGNGGCSGSGGGGGQGGEGGDGGRGGSGGGGSFGVAVGFSSEATIVDCVINTARGGDGGTGHDGFDGGLGGPRGTGATASGGGPGGNGGMGGKGGRGGPGGGGGGGPSIGIAVHYTSQVNADWQSRNSFPHNNPPGGPTGGTGGNGGVTQSGNKGATGLVQDYFEQPQP